MKAFLKVVLLFLCLSCEKDELPVEKYDRGGVSTAALELGADYRYQVFYDLSSKREVSRNLKTSWDLGFGCAVGGFQINLNSSRSMMVFNSGKTKLEEVTKKPSTGWVWDMASGHPDSNAIGSWAVLNGGVFTSKNEVYVLDLGYDHMGKQLGYKKIQFTSVNEQAYEFIYADLNGNNQKQFRIEKDANYNCVYFTFSDGGASVLVEPKKTEWDLVFTQYTHTFFDNPLVPTPYQVTGVLMNPHLTYAKKDTTKTFSAFSSQDALDLELDSALNTIGYKWKEYNYDNGSYLIFSEYNFIIKDQQEFYYKLHFIDFYNTTGEKGTPTFEFQQL